MLCVDVSIVTLYRCVCVFFMCVDLILQQQQEQDTTSATPTKARC